MTFKVKIPCCLAYCELAGSTRHVDVTFNGASSVTSFEVSSVDPATPDIIEFDVGDAPIGVHPMMVTVLDHKVTVNTIVLLTDLLLSADGGATYKSLMCASTNSDGSSIFSSLRIADHPKYCTILPDEEPFAFNIELPSDFNNRYVYASWQDTLDQVSEWRSVLIAEHESGIEVNNYEARIAKFDAKIELAKSQLI